MRILVVCGAGASSTFVAQRLRRAALHAGLDWDAAAGTENSVFPGAQDVVLLGPHLADRVDAVRESAGVPVALLPADIFADRDGDRTLALVRALVADAETTPKGTP
jgi:PTS system cellobiose-specific IIB component